jgi:hypothetical protein
MFARCVAFSDDDDLCRTHRCLPQREIDPLLLLPASISPLSGERIGENPDAVMHDMGALTYVVPRMCHSGSSPSGLCVEAPLSVVDGTPHPVNARIVMRPLCGPLSPVHAQPLVCESEAIDIGPNLGAMGCGYLGCHDVLLWMKN